MRKELILIALAPVLPLLLTAPRSDGPSGLRDMGTLLFFTYNIYHEHIRASHKLVIKLCVHLRLKARGTTKHANAPIQV